MHIPPQEQDIYSQQNRNNTRYQPIVENFIKKYSRLFVGNCGELCNFETKYLI